MRNKKCFKCKDEMKKGYIQCSNRIAWVPNISKLSVEPSLNKDAVLLSKQSRLSINHVEAYLCERCKNVIVDYSNESGD